MSGKLMCPSAYAGLEESVVLGVVERGTDGPRVAYLNDALPATSDILELAGPVHAGTIFRLAAKCQAASCVHFDGSDCRLAKRIIEGFSSVVSSLPRCAIRPHCRWFHQEGTAACERCPQVVTVNYAASEEIARVSGLPIIEA